MLGVTVMRLRTRLHGRRDGDERGVVDGLEAWIYEIKKDERVGGRWATREGKGRETVT